MDADIYFSWLVIRRIIFALCRPDDGDLLFLPTQTPPVLNVVTISFQDGTSTVKPEQLLLLEKMTRQGLSSVFSPFLVSEAALLQQAAAAQPKEAASCDSEISTDTLSLRVVIVVASVTCCLARVRTRLQLVFSIMITGHMHVDKGHF